MARPRHHFAKWTDDLDQQLTYLWYESPISYIARRLGRSESAIYGRAKVLQLPLGVPPGWETLAAAHRRTGYEERTIHLIFEFVARLEKKPIHWRPVRSAMAQPYPRATAKRTRIVDTFDLDEAIAAYQATEFVAPAAIAAGMHARRLKRILEERCQLVQWGRGHRHRARTSDIEAAIRDADEDTAQRRHIAGCAGAAARIAKYNEAHL